MKNITVEKLDARYYKNRIPSGYYCKSIKANGTLSDEHDIYCLSKVNDMKWFIDEYLKQCNEIINELEK